MYPYIDMHCDSLLRVLEQGERSLYDGEGMLSIEKMVSVGQMCQFFAVFFRPEWQGKDEAKDLSYERNKGHGRDKDMYYFKRLRNALYEQVKSHNDIIAMAHNYDEIRANRADGRASAVLAVEDGRMVQGSMESLQDLYEAGVRSMALTWNHANCFGYPNSKKTEIMRKGLTYFGKEAVEEMNRLGMLIDVSHLSDGGFWDVAFLSEKPFIASHSNCRSLTPHPRNLSDDMIVCLAQKGGVAGVNFYPLFTTGRKYGAEALEKKEVILQAEKRDETVIRSRVQDLVAHVMHFFRTGGEDCVGIGTDFDGMEGALEISSPLEMDLLFQELQKAGMTGRQLDKFAYGNVLRVIKESMK